VISVLVIHLKRVGTAQILALAVLTFGCQASRSSDSQPSPQVQNPTFTRDIAPIVFERCSPCHRPGQSAPFPLLAYGDARQRVQRIAEATRTRFMPPWLPEPGYGEFAHERRLQQAQIDLIQRWVEQGAVEGSASDLPSLPKWPEGWQLGEPDLVVRLPEPFTLRPAGEDVFRNFVISVPVDSTKYVRAVEFRPDNTQLVHHATIGIDRTRASRRLDAADPEPGYEGMFSEGLESPDGHFLSWTPGKVPTAEPADMAWPLDRGTDLVVQLHMLPARDAKTIQPSVGLFFTDKPPTRTPFVVKLGSNAIDIPPGGQHTLKDVYRLPVDVDALSVYPHAHYLAKTMQAFATLPDGNVKWLLRINDWDFHWQDHYYYAAPVFLPRGTVLTMQYTYDNSSSNQHGPHPPARVMFGPKSSDEMGDLWLQVLPRDPRDIAALARDYAQRALASDIALAEARVRLSPTNASRHNELGVAYLRVRNVDAAITHFREALRLTGEYADAHNNLGDALQQAGRLEEAIGHFRQAQRLKPNDDRVHFNMGNALRADGQEDAAIRAFRRAININPDFAEAHNNLGVGLASQQKFQEAARHFAAAVSSNPDYADAYNNLGLALGSLGDVAGAIRHRRRALEIRPNYRDAAGNLEFFLKSANSSGARRE
jgi:tetratricopeptide (TPR) repeat protein/mono/diheme cytochrome c family protein